MQLHTRQYMTVTLSELSSDNTAGDSTQMCLRKGLNDTRLIQWQTEETEDRESHSLHIREWTAASLSLSLTTYQIFYLE